MDNVRKSTQAERQEWQNKHRKSWNKTFKFPHGGKKRKQI